MPCLFQYECHKTAVQSAYQLFHTGAVASCLATTAPLSQYRLNHMNIPCVCAHIPVSIALQTMSIAPVLAVLTIMHVSMLINNIILEYTDHVRVYTDLWNIWVTNAGWMIHVDSLILLLPVCGLLSWSIWGLLRLIPIISVIIVFPNYCVSRNS